MGACLGETMDPSIREVLYTCLRSGEESREKTACTYFLLVGKQEKGVIDYNLVRNVYYIIDRLQPQLRCALSFHTSFNVFTVVLSQVTPVSQVAPFDGNRI